LDRLAQYRYDGTELPDNEEGREFVFIIACHLREPVRIRRVLAEIAPWYDDEDEIEKLIKRVTMKQYRFRAATIAKRLHVTWAEHCALGLKTIGSVDKPLSAIAAEAMAALARKRARDRRWRQRKRRGMKKPPQTRAQYEAGSLSRTQPWLAEGIGRRQWERRRAPACGGDG
jgi:hypothetical protein